MTSTYPSRNGIREIESKKVALNALETALKKRVGEFKELCLKEGELTGHLPIDYPLQPREPIPQIRRRITHSNDSNGGNNNTNLISENFNISQTASIKSREHRLPNIQPQSAFAISQNANISFPSRPTSTNSTSSSISTASSNTRNSNNAHISLNNHINRHLLTPSIASSSSNQSTSLNNGFSNLYNEQFNKLLRNHQPVRYDRSLLPNQFKRPFNLPTSSSFDGDVLGHMRASSTASSSSSSGSGASSTLSAPTMPNLKTSTSLNSITNLHARSYSENVSNKPATVYSSNILDSSNQHANQSGQQQAFNLPTNFTVNPNCPPPRPPRGLVSNHDFKNSSGQSVKDGQNLMVSSSENSITSVNRNPVDVTQENPRPRFEIDGVANFQPYYEESKPFQMSDFYKYSSKHRQKINDTPIIKTKTTRQLQEEVSKKYSLKLPSCDDQIQASVKLIEKSGQKLIEATAKAIAGNPGLAEKINNILPNNGDRY